MKPAWRLGTSNLFDADGRSRGVVFPVRLFPDDGEVRVRRLDRIRFPGEPDGRYLHARLELALRLPAAEPKLLRRVVDLDWLVPRGPAHVDLHASRRRVCVAVAPDRLIVDLHPR